MGLRVVELDNEQTILYTGICPTKLPQSTRQLTRYEFNFLGLIPVCKILPQTN